jgi:hypothetical protein
MMGSSKTKDPLIQSIKDLVAVSHDLARRAEQEYTCEVDAVIAEECREPERIEYLLDGMLDFGFDAAMVCLYKKLCRYYFTINPEATISYVNAYRDMWEEKESLKGEGGRGISCEGQTCRVWSAECGL